MLKTLLNLKSVRACISSRFALTLLVTVMIVTTAIPPHSNAQTTPPAAQQYTFVSLSAPFPGVTSTLGYGVNDRGDVVGAYQINPDPLGNPTTAGQHGFVLKNGTYTTIDVPFPGATSTGAVGINNHGVIVGSYSDGSFHGFVLRRGVFTSFDFPGPNAVDTSANGINDEGTIVGDYFDLVSQQRRGFILERGIFYSVDVPFTGACCTSAGGINNRGHIVGSYIGADGVGHGFTLKRGTFTTFDQSFPPDFPAPFASQNALPCGISNRGEIVGPGFLFLHGDFTQLSDLDPFFEIVGGGTCGVNDKGIVVGNTMPNLVNPPPLGNSAAGFLLMPE
ncbi:MAG: hypothetical protein ABSE51_16070 [Terracidiphilus sp.]